jgi:hypothetical protein
MGLDAYLMTVPLPDDKTPSSSRDLEKDCKYQPQIIHSWRKHWNLQNYIRLEWEANGDDDNNDFNCVAVKFTSKLLDDIRRKVITNQLMREDDDTEEECERTKQDTLLALEKAEMELEIGHTVYYNSWW